MTTFTVENPERMAALGAALATRLRAGDLVMLNGELGAGKTTLTRAIGEALGIRGTVTSPTFVLARTHPRQAASRSDSATEPHNSTVDTAPLVHVDAYRLSSAVELDDLDIDFAASIVVVEWGAGLLDGVSDSWLTVDIVRPTGGGAAGGGATVLHGEELDLSEEPVEPRTVTVTGHGERWKDVGWLDALSD